MASNLLLPGTLALLVALILARLLKPRPRLPPGPRGLPILGNILSLPSSHLHLHPTSLAAQYGPLLTLQLGPAQTVVVMSSARVQADLLDRLGGKTSGRPRIVFAGEVMCRNLLYVFMQYGERWRKLRKVTHEGFNIRACEAYYPFQEEEARNLVLSLLPSPTIPSPPTPDDLPKKLKHASAASTFRALYSGPSLTTASEEIVRRIDEVSEDVLKHSKPLAHLVDVFPWMLYLPDWMAPWRRWGEEWFRETDGFYRRVMREGMKVEKGEHARGFIATTAPSFSKLEVTEQEAAWTAGGLFGAGVETTSAVLHFFVQAMILHPSVARTAQSHLDAICGPRPPTFADREKLPYIQALVKEVLRWRPVAPLGMPHVAMSDVAYEGYTIPKGTLLMGNIWAISRDPAFFPQPDAFDPTRFLTPAGEVKQAFEGYHDDIIAYGSGRRICPGRDFANNTLFIDCATLLWAFDFAPGRDEQGREVEVRAEGVRDDGLVIHPEPFAYTLTPRRLDLKEILTKGRDH